MCVLKFSFLTYIELHYLHILSRRWIYLSWDDLGWSQRGLKSPLSAFHVLCRVYSLHCMPIWPIWTSFVLSEPFIYRSDMPAPDRYALGGLEFGFILYWWWDSKRANPSGRVKSAPAKDVLFASPRILFASGWDFNCTHLWILLTIG